MKTELRAAFLDLHILHTRNQLGRDLEESSPFKCHRIRRQEVLMGAHQINVCGWVRAYP